jgi:hypothetical protein
MLLSSNTVAQTGLLFYRYFYRFKCVTQLIADLSASEVQSFLCYCSSYVYDVATRHTQYYLLEFLGLLFS